MKFIAVILFSFLLLTQTFSKWLLVIDYTINKEFIAKNLCENRSKPMLRCHGKCQLMKKMAAEEDGSNKSSSGSQAGKNTFSEVWYNDDPVDLLQTAPVSKATHNGFYSEHNYSTPLSSIFHPPLV